jgi:hypothetical protein
MPLIRRPRPRRVGRGLGRGVRGWRGEHLEQIMN